MVNKAHLHSVRIGINIWMDDDNFDHLLRLLAQYGSSITDVALVVGFAHSPLKVEVLNQQVQTFKKRVSALKEAGFSAGINNLTTLVIMPRIWMRALATGLFS